MKLIRFGNVGNEKPGTHIDGKNYAATQANFNVSSSLEPIYSLSKSGVATWASSSPLKGSFSLDYYVNSSGDYIADLFDRITSGNIGTNINPVGISLGEQEFTRAYLTSHTVNAQPNQLVTAKANFDLYFENASEALGFGNIPADGFVVLPTGIAHGSASSVGEFGGITDSISFSYESPIQYNFIFKIGNSAPERVYVTQASKKITIEGYDINSSISMCGNSAIAKASVLPLCTPSGIVYTVSGNITSLEGNVSAGQVGKSKATIIQFI